MPEIAFVFTAELAGGLVADCLHGANRLASNSLLECVVIARLAAQTIADEQAFQAVSSQRPPERPSAEAGIFSDGLQNTFSRPALQAFNQHHLGILRNDTGLCCAITQLRFWKQNQSEPHTATATYSNAASPSPKPHTGGDRSSEHILIVIVKADSENISPINKVID